MCSLATSKIKYHERKIIFPFKKTTSILIHDVTVNSKEKGMLDMDSKIKYCHFYLEALWGDDNSKEKGIIRYEYNG